MFVSSVVYPNRVKDTEQSWEEEEDRSIISSPTLSIDENKFLNKVFIVCVITFIILVLSKFSHPNLIIN